MAASRAGGWLGDGARRHGDRDAEAVRIPVDRRRVDRAHALRLDGHRHMLRSAPQRALERPSERIGPHALRHQQPDGAGEAPVAHVRRVLRIICRPQHERRHEVDRARLARALLAEHRDVTAPAHVADVAAGEAARLRVGPGLAGPEVHAAGHDHRPPHPGTGTFAGRAVHAAPPPPEEPRSDADACRRRQRAEHPALQRAHRDAVLERRASQRLADDHRAHDAEPRPADEHGRADRDRHHAAAAVRVDHVGRGAADEAVRARRDLERALRAAQALGGRAVGLRGSAGEPRQRVRAAGTAAPRDGHRGAGPRRGARAGGRRVRQSSPSGRGTRPGWRSGSSRPPASGAGTPCGRRSGPGRRRAC